LEGYQILATSAAATAVVEEEEEEDEEEEMRGAAGKRSVKNSSSSPRASYRASGASETLKRRKNCFASHAAEKWIAYLVHGRMIEEMKE
jgi:hypothetical protein